MITLIGQYKVIFDDEFHIEIINTKEYRLTYFSKYNYQGKLHIIPYTISTISQQFVIHRNNKIAIDFLINSEMFDCSQLHEHYVFKLNNLGKLQLL